MTAKGYGQFCGLARAAEVLGQRWTLLIVRDLLVGPRRYSDLASGLPGAATNLLATRLRELEHAGLVRRELDGRAVVYALTPRGLELEPVVHAIARWGAAGMRHPRDGEVVTESSLVSALQVAAKGGQAPARTWSATVVAGDAVAHVTAVRRRPVEVGPGAHFAPDLVVTAGSGFRDLLAGEVDVDAAVAEGAVLVDGDPTLLPDFVAVLRVPFSDAPDRDTWLDPTLVSRGLERPA